MAGCTTRGGSGRPAPSVPAYVGPEQLTASDQTYAARWVPPGQIRVDGRADEPAWAQAAVENRFSFPWKAAPAPLTEFRALWDNEHLYFTFRVQDADIVALEHWRDELDSVFEDRVEIYLSRDGKMRDYYCAEIDSRGRVLDYRARFYRRFEMDWRFRGLETRATTHMHGYEVEGRIPLRELAGLGFPMPQPGVKIRVGLYRAEFSHDRSGRAAAASGIHTLGRSPPGASPVEEWISWVNPRTAEPDFHVPSSLGWLEFVK
ncbi:MAG: carbohydrate-binding family 9-like protein [Verrucomicrobiae bacterium]|nr:carbohydrate-binding family 9-like protein [Verrucomicrobiae bacterium]